MTNELREAAERHGLMRSWKHPSEWKDFGSAEQGAARHKDLVLLADAYLAEHPSDDDTPIDDEFMASIRWVQIGNTWYPPEPSLPKSPQYESAEPLLFWESVSGMIWICRAGWKSVPRATRGQLRRLCKSLGIELREGGR